MSLALTFEVGRESRWSRRLGLAFCMKAAPAGTLTNSHSSFSTVGLNWECKNCSPFFRWSSVIEPAAGQGTRCTTTGTPSTHSTTMAVRPDDLPYYSLGLSRGEKKENLESFGLWLAMTAHQTLKRKFLVELPVSGRVPTPGRWVEPTFAIVQVDPEVHE